MLVSPRSCIPAVVLSFVLAPAVFAGPSKVPARLAQARYVALAYDLGDVLLSESEAVSRPGLVMPEDREALNAVRSQLEKWGRYVITIGPAQADLLVAVRAGRRASASAAVRIGGRPPLTTCSPSTRLRAAAAAWCCGADSGRPAFPTRRPPCSRTSRRTSSGPRNTPEE